MSDAPPRKRLNADERRARKAAAFRRFVRQYQRRTQKGSDPNDRHYDRDIENAAKRMKPDELDRLLRDDA